jgi:2-methylisocitrate lyase-like PEP mutase family enzyme
MAREPEDEGPSARGPHRDRYDEFLATHHGPSPLLLPNPWDEGSARLLEWLGFAALATTSSGLAATRGRLDGAVLRQPVLDHAAAVVRATGLPVTADLENGFGDDPSTVAETVRLAVDTGLAGCSIEDFTGRPERPIYDDGPAVERVVAAVEAAHAGPNRLVLTARAEHYLHGRADLEATITRLQAYQEAGADVLYAPGLSLPGDIGRLVAAVDRPVNVLARPGGPTVDQLGELGVARVSLGGSLCFAALGAVVEAATEFKEQGTYGFMAKSAEGRDAALAAFGR